MRFTSESIGSTEECPLVDTTHSCEPCNCYSIDCPMFQYGSRQKSGDKPVEVQGHLRTDRCQQMRRPTPEHVSPQGCQAAGPPARLAQIAPEHLPHSCSYTRSRTHSAACCKLFPWFTTGGNARDKLVTVGRNWSPIVLLPYLPAAGRLAHQRHILAVVVRLTQHDLHNWVDCWMTPKAGSIPLLNFCRPWDT